MNYSLEVDLREEITGVTGVSKNTKVFMTERPELPLEKV